MPAKYVVHTVGPVYSKSNSAKSEEMLRSAYRRSLEEASRIKDVKSIVSVVGCGMRCGTS